MKKFVTFAILAIFCLFSSGFFILTAYNYKGKSKLIVLPQKQEANVWLPKNTEFLLYTEFNNINKCNKTSFDDFKKRFSESGIVGYFYIDSRKPSLFIRKSDLNGNCYITFYEINKPKDWQKGIEIEKINLENGKFFIYPRNTYKEKTNSFLFVSIILLVMSVLCLIISVSEKRGEKKGKSNKI